MIRFLVVFFKDGDIKFIKNIFWDSVDDKIKFINDVTFVDTFSVICYNNMSLGYKEDEELIEYLLNNYEIKEIKSLDINKCIRISKLNIIFNEK